MCIKSSVLEQEGGSNISAKEKEQQKATKKPIPEKRY